MTLAAQFEHVRELYNGAYGEDAFEVAGVAVRTSGGQLHLVVQTAESVWFTLTVH